MAITRQSKIVSIGDADTELLVAAADTSVAVVFLLFGAIHADGATIILNIYKSGGSLTPIEITRTIALNAPVQYCTGGKGAIFLSVGDRLSALASVAGKVNAFISYVVETT